MTVKLIQTHKNFITHQINIIKSIFLILPSDTFDI